MLPHSALLLLSFSPLVFGWQSPFSSGSSSRSKSHNFVSPDGQAPTFPLGGPQFWGSEALSFNLSPRDEAHSFALSKDGSIVAVASDFGVRLLQADDLTTERVLPRTEYTESVEFHPDGRRLAIGRVSQNGNERLASVELVDYRSGDPFALGQTEAVEEGVAATEARLRLDGGAEHNDAAQHDEMVRALKTVLATTDVQHGLRDGSLFAGVRTSFTPSFFSVDGAQILTVDKFGGHALLARVDDPKSQRELPTDLEPIMFVGFNPAGTVVAATSWIGMVVVWDVQTGDVLHRLTPPAPKAVDRGLPQLWAAAFSPDGTQLAVGAGDRSVYIWSVASGTLEHTLSGFGGWVRALAWSPDGSSLACGSEGPEVRVFDMPSGSQRQHWSVKMPNSYPDEEVEKVLYSQDGKRLTFGVTDGRKIVYEEATNRIWETSPDPQDKQVQGYGDIALSANGSRLFSLLPNLHVLRVWNLDDK